LETLLPLLLKLVAEGAMILPEGIAALTSKPAQILGLRRGELTPGFPADVCVFDPDSTWKIEAGSWRSQGTNTPFWGRTMKGRVTHTLQAGRIIHGPV
jgi:dihydroorotase